MKCECTTKSIAYYLDHCPLHNAAPEMYDALRALLEITDPGIDGNKDAYVQAKIALAKAEGR